MAEPRTLVIIGAGGQGAEAAWVAAAALDSAGDKAWRLLGFVDDAPELAGAVVAGRPVLGSVATFIERHRDGACHFHCAIGRNEVRKRIAAVLEGRGFVPATLIASTACIGPGAVVGPGSYVGHHAYVGPEARIGRHVLVNVHVSVGHHSVSGDFVQYCPGVRVSGGCGIEEGAFLGSNAVTAPLVRMGAWASLGANAFASRDIAPGTLVAGNPARKIR